MLMEQLVSFEIPSYSKMTYHTNLVLFAGGCSTWIYVPNAHVDGPTRVQVHTTRCCRSGLAISFQTEPSFPLLQCDSATVTEEGKYSNCRVKVAKQKQCLSCCCFKPSILFLSHFPSRPLCFSQIGPPAAVLSGVTLQNPLL